MWPDSPSLLEFKDQGGTSHLFTACPLGQTLLFTAHPPPPKSCQVTYNTILQLRNPRLRFKRELPKVTGIIDCGRI